ncbi:MAG: alkaline phosphatase family protein [Actinomycetota bacterium]|nr:alkaline phosphatase family protein [Actinomycetota bacterium]
MAKSVAIGLDGAAWHLLDPMLGAGAMPRLAALKAKGAWGTLTSTIPTYTPPAWTSAATGVNPGRHGIYGFVAGNAQSERQELVHSGMIKAPAIWEITNEQGARAGIYNLPLTYPPRPLDGWMVSGMMTPGYGEHLEGFASWGGAGKTNSELEHQILRWAPDYVVDVSANYEQDWRDEGLARRALDSIRQREAVLRGLLELDPPDVLFTVMEAPDRLQHVYYRYMDPADDLYSSRDASRIRSAVVECFSAIDRIVGLLEDYAGADGGVVVCSDHGFTAWEVSVHVNALLEGWGYLKLKGGGKAMQSELTRKMIPLAKRFLPRRLARRAKGRTFAAIDWAATTAFASPIPQQGVFVNLAGRERYGIVPREKLGALKDEIAARFLELRDDRGEPVTDRVHRGEDVFHGDALEGAPDLLPVLRDHRYELDDELFHREPFTDLRHLPRGVHHPDGIVIVAGAGTHAGRVSGSVLDVTPTLLYQARLKVPEGLDGRVLTPAFDAALLSERPVATTAALSSADRDEASPYSQEEEALIEESLRGLGYL